MKIVGVCVAGLLASACMSPAPAQPVGPAAMRNAENPALAAILADYEAYSRQVDPISAGMEGDKAALSRLPDNSRAFEVAQEPALAAFARRLDAIDRAALSAADALNHAFLAYVIDRTLQAYRWIRTGWMRSTRRAGRVRRQLILRG